jgi:hypothetical protein
LYYAHIVHVQPLFLDIGAAIVLLRSCFASHRPRAGVAFCAVNDPAICAARAL